MQTEFFVSKGDEQLGPWSIDEIVERLGKGEISATDFIFDDVAGDWIPMLECAALKERLNRAKPKAPPPKRAAPTAPVAAPVAQAQPAPAQEAKPAQVQEAKPAPASALPAADKTEWFVQKGAHRFGPFTYLGLVKGLQEKTVYDFDYVWKEGMDSWVRVAEHEEFQPERIRLLKTQATSESASEEVFAKRMHKRVAFDGEVIVHDDRSVWMGVAFEASVGGSGLVIENATLTPGQVVRLHFAQTKDLPAFNALAEIVGKRYSNEVKAANSPVKYAVRFLKIDGIAEPHVKEYFAR